MGQYTQIGVLIQSLTNYLAENYMTLSQNQVIFQDRILLIYTDSVNLLIDKDMPNIPIFRDIGFFLSFELLGVFIPQNKRRKGEKNNG